MDYADWIGKRIRVASGDNYNGCGWVGILTASKGIYSVAVENHFVDCVRTPKTIQFTDKDVAFSDNFAGDSIRIQLRKV